MHGFSIAMIVGIVVGTYSSIYIASASALISGHQPRGFVAEGQRNRG
jgi:preprotein translocase subunit SecF